MAKLREPDSFVKINDTIRLYGGAYANWRGGGCKAPIPPELIDKLVMIEEEVGDYLKRTGRLGI